MLGAIIGDIVGSRFESDNHRSKDFELFGKGCFATDDSIMSLSIAKAIMETSRKIASDPFTHDNAYHAALSKMTVKYMQEIGRCYPNCGFGGKFYHWVFSDSPQPYNSFGNGAAMRISPVGFYAKSKEDAIALSKTVTAVTHNHPEGIKGAEATAVAIYLARRGALKREIRQEIEKNYYPLNFTIDQIRSTYRFNATCQDTVPQAIQCFLESNSFEDAIRTAISLGGDSDTIAAIAVAIAEAYYGIPEEIKEQAISHLDPFLRSLLVEWVDFIPPETERYKLITKYIGWLSDRLCFSDTPIRFEADFPFTDFENDWINSEFAQPNYAAILETMGVPFDYKGITTQLVEALNAEQILALIASAFRMDQFSKGAFYEIIRSGTMLKWLQRLKDLDWRQTPKHIEVINYTHWSVTNLENTIVHIHNGIGTILKSRPGEKNEPLRFLSRQETVNLLAEFAQIHPEYWKYNYPQEGELYALDGLGWYLGVAYQDQTTQEFHGDNTAPANWAALISILERGKYEDPYAPSSNIHRFEIKLYGNHDDRKGSEESAGSSNFMESMSLDHELGELVIEQQVIDRFKMTHRFELHDKLDILFSILEVLAERTDWHDSIASENPQGSQVFEMTTTFHDGSTVFHRGIYSRVDIPQAVWMDFMAALNQTLEDNTISELFSLQKFLSYKKPGEIKICSVSFNEGGKTYYYRTEDNGIAKGDQVIVPVGFYNEEKQGIVEKIEFFHPLTPPFPLQKTKSILRKV